MRWILFAAVVAAAIALEVLRRRQAALETPDRCDRLRAIYRQPVLYKGREHHPRLIPFVDESARIKRFKQRARRRA